jgi:hypothetical protein
MYLNMAVFQTIERLIGSLLGVEYFQKGKKRHDFAIGRLIKMEKRSRKRIWAVCGEFNNERVSGEETATIIKKEISKNNSFDVRFLFAKTLENKYGNNIDQRKKEAIEIIKQEKNNKYILEVFLSELNKNGNIKIYWANKRPVFHFHLCDNNVFLEEKHLPPSIKGVGNPRAVLITKNDKRLANKYEQHFVNMANMKDVVVQLFPIDFN